jgi:hypothetical protein
MKHNHKTVLLAMIALAASSVLGIAVYSRGQDQTQPSPANPVLAQTQPAAQAEWTADQLDNLVAPLALFPDPLLSQMLVASTYPLEVVEANQWLQQNRNLQGQALIDAAKQQPWDASIQALVAVPDALEKLNQDIRWTTDLGNAFLAQEADVMNAVQRMRIRAEGNGHLASTKQQTVFNESERGQQVVTIEPAYPDVIYVPVYDPFYVWGPPVYGFYPPLYYPPYGFGFGLGFNIGFCFDNWGGWNYWGWGPNWFGNTVFVNTYFFNHYGFHHPWRSNDRGRLAWVHNPVHRLNVPYRTPQVAARFSGHMNEFRNLSRTAQGRNGSGTRFTSPTRNRSSGYNPGQGNRNALFPAARYQSLSRRWNQAPQQNQTPSNRNRMTNPARRQQGQAQARFQARQERGYAPQRYRQSPRLVPLRTQRPQEHFREPQQYRSSPQVHRAPQQRFGSSQRFRSAPLMSAGRSNGGGFGRSGVGGGAGRGGGAGHRRR